MTDAQEWKAKADRLLYERWYVISNDVVGGWSIAAINKPVSEIIGLEHIIADDVLTQEIASYIVAVHNYRLGQSDG
jgi:hypothetical protein